MNVSVCSYAVSFPVTLFNILSAYRAGTGKQPNMVEAMRPMVTFMAGFVICAAWAALSPNRILDLDARCYFLLSGTLYANMSCRLIIAQLTSTRCELFNWLLAPMAVTAVVVTLVPGVSANVELGGVYFLTALVCLVHLHYVTCVVVQMCDHLNISCFRVPPAATAASGATTTAANDGKGDHRLLVADESLSESSSSEDDEVSAVPTGTS